MKVLVTGSAGQLGSDLVTILSQEGYEVYGFDRNQMDITNIENVRRIIEDVKPDVVVHAAAYTNVDLAESERDQAFLVNAIGTRNIAIFAERVSAKLVYISTDYVFNGMAESPINEFTPTDPINVYGQSKLAGEQFVRDFHNQFFIVRTSWVFGLHGNNFVKTMLKQAKTKEKITVVADQIGSPTYTVDLSKMIVELIRTEKYGIYHISNSGKCSWYEFAKAIYDEAGIHVHVVPCTSKEYPRPAKRPAFSVLDHMNLRLNGFHEPRNWKDALHDFIHQLGNL